MRAANLFLFLGTVGFINIYDELTGEDDLPTGKIDPSDAKRLQRKFGVKEKRSPGAGSQVLGGLVRPLTTVSNIEEYSEELIEHLKRPVYRGLSGCDSADGNACNCLRLVCFGQAQCMRHTNATLTKPLTRAQAAAPAPPIPLGDPRYVYYATGERLRSRQHTTADNSTSTLPNFVRCRQTTIDPYVLCECKAYRRNRDQQPIEPQQQQPPLTPKVP